MTATRSTAAVAALVSALPTPKRLRAQAGARPGDIDGSSAVTATFVGEVSADVALVLVDRASVEAATTQTVSAVDLLRPALDAAVGVLGHGVLGPVTTGRTPLFVDPDASVFELRSDDGIDGWFAIRIHPDAPTGGSGLPIADRIGRIRNVEMTLTVELGRTRMPVRDVLGLEPGSTVELDRSVGAPADVLLNGRLIAHGEIVVVDQDYAVRITRILDTAEDGR